MYLALVLALSTVAPAVPTPQHSIANLDFASGKLDGWEGEGFYLTTATGQGPSRRLGVCSSDCGPKGKTALLHRTFVVPKGAGMLRFTAFVAGSLSEEPTMDVVLEGPGRLYLDKHQRSGDGFKTVQRLLTADNGQPREYFFPLEEVAGQTVRLILVDKDNTPGNYLFCSGFEFIPAGHFELRAFEKHMKGLAHTHKLTRMQRLDSEHFVAVGNAEEGFTKRRLLNCELLYDLFLPHFQEAGFRVRRPAGPLMVAIFETHEGLGHYFDNPMPPGITGLYHPASNRLVVYDYGTNPELIAERRRREESAQRIESDVDRQFILGLLDRKAEELRKDVNIETVMHEVAHQLSFNCGLLNRHGDVAVWLAEGLATYCEPTEEGLWKGIGARNPRHLKTIRDYQKRYGKLLPVRSLLENDDWMRRGDGNTKLLGYAQSWALFRMLMEENPKTLKRYLEHIYTRKTNDQRLYDWVAVFGPDLQKMEKRHLEYIQRLLETDR